MKEICLKALIFIGIFTALLIPGSDSFASQESSPPPDFVKISSASGIEFFRKDYPGGTPDFVQVVRLDQGAKVKPLHGDIVDYRPGQGSFGGNDAQITTKPLQQFWNETATVNSNLFCVSNGQFFKMGEAPTRLPFSLKVNNEIISDGYGKEEHVGEKVMLEIWSNRADIRELNEENLYSSSAPDIIAGLTEDGRKSPTKYVARTFIGIDDRDGDQNYETMLVFNTRSTRQKDAADVLRAFGADKVMMLDGGGSTQLICENSHIIKSERLIPQAIGVFSGNGSTSPVVQNSVVGSVFDFGGGDQITSSEIAQAGINISDTKWILIVAVPVALFMFLTITRLQRRVYF